jgi:nucleolar MIF4G domain-containing protein 1
LIDVQLDSGKQLRQDDPSALKEIIANVQMKVSSQDDLLRHANYSHYLTFHRCRFLTYSSRTRFMIETLINLKNNKIKRTAGQQHQGGEAVERMKKFLSGMAKKRHGMSASSAFRRSEYLTSCCTHVVLAYEPLRVSLDDLHTAESKGKWWLVGAAWGGDPLVDRQDTTKASENTDANDISNNTLLKLARKQGMNTDIRRSIFVVLMSSDVGFILCSGSC